MIYKFRTILLVSIMQCTSWQAIDCCRCLEKIIFPKPHPATKVVLKDYNYDRDYADVIKAHHELDDQSLRFLRMNSRDQIEHIVNYWFPNRETKIEAQAAGDRIETKIMRTSDGQLIGGITCLTRELKKTDGAFKGTQKAEYKIAYIFVAKNFQGKGHGRQLMNAGIDFFVKKGHKTILLDIVPDNARALHLYKSLGFEIIKTEPNNISMKLQK